MCIAILSTTHPHYRFILINNRDGYLSRPTSPATWWPIPNTQVLGARDLARPAHGTWLGITTHGRFAVLTNCLETDCARAVGGKEPRGIINRWLTSPSTLSGTQTDGVVGFVSGLQRNGELDGVGGFNLLLGDISQPESESESESGRVVIISNGSPAIDRDCCNNGNISVLRIGTEPDQTLTLSNMTLGEDHNPTTLWKKISLGETLTSQAIPTSLQEHEDEDSLIERLFSVLSTDTLPRIPGEEGVAAEKYLGLLRESIFIPVIGEAVEGEATSSYMEGLYGTQTQTVVLIGYDGRVRYVARTLYDEDGRPKDLDERDRSFECWTKRGSR
ncbi:NRDE protein-domain-containing protein [Aspergillus cavernicola]|uniref:NRDE protein-domain-containing protein n=1 Tax=Aspergillus cavernicola TaxID=176166 RepID=A0ABR4I7W0_9EURO